MVQNIDTTTLPPIDQVTCDDFIKDYENNPLMFIQQYCKFLNSSVEEYFFSINLTYEEYEHDLQYVDKPITFNINKITNPDKTTTEDLGVNITHAKYYFSKDEQTFDREWVTETFKINGFKPLPPPPNPFDPTHSPQL
jgi:hypothetical protein